MCACLLNVGSEPVDSLASQGQVLWLQYSKIRYDLSVRGSNTCVICQSLSEEHISLRGQVTRGERVLYLEGSVLIQRAWYLV